MIRSAKSTITSTVTRTQLSTIYTASSTSTHTSVIVVPTPTSYPGMNYYVYPNTYNYLTSNPGFNATTFNSPKYNESGVVDDVNLEHTYNYPSSDNSCHLPGNYYGPCGQVTIVNQGYFHAAESGSYTFATNSTMDNAMYVWSGDVAYDSYTNSNWDYSATRQGYPVVETPGNKTYTLTAGELMPMTIMFVNGGGPGRAVISVTNPDGVTNGTSGYFLPPCDDTTFSP